MSNKKNIDIKDIKVTKKIDCMGENCPIPLIKTREAIINAKKGDVIQVVGNHPNSFDEIPMALNALGIKILKKEQLNHHWEIIFKV